mmetsp:Transcript_49046/g.151408  ORF Transcript_49046/g.151408 Transcript_49046/m.151408 type:complete len:256 (-) Transcript_49046:674-1441(-)
MESRISRTAGCSCAGSSSATRAVSTACKPSSSACWSLPAVTCTTGFGTPHVLEGHSRSSGALVICSLGVGLGVGSVDAAPTAAPGSAASGADDSVFAARSAPPSPAPSTSPTTSWACRCSVGGRGLQVLCKREGVVGSANAILHKHASGEMRFQDSSMCRASRSRHCTKDWRTLNCRDSMGRCLELKRSHSLMATLAASKGASLYCVLQSAVLLSSTPCNARTPSSVACRSASGVRRVPMPWEGAWASSAFRRQS